MASVDLRLHPRNKLATRPPSFLELAADDAEFAKHVRKQDRAGHECAPYIDWRDPTAVTAFTRSLLIQRFGLQEWSCPPDRLCPTVTSRLNYVLWAQDLVASHSLLLALLLLLPVSASPSVSFVDGGNNSNASSSLVEEASVKISAQADTAAATALPLPLCLDVGTGASCIFPLLAAKECGFRCIGTDIDEKSAGLAIQNVVTNKLENSISILLMGSASSASSSSFSSSSNSGGAAASSSSSSSSTSFHRLRGNTLISDAVEWAVQRENKHIDAPIAIAPSHGSLLWSVPEEGRGGGEARARASTRASTRARARSVLAQHAQQTLSNPSTFSFTMSNPPFFSSWEEAEASMRAASFKGVCTGSPAEMWCEGGEVAFVSRMIDESANCSNNLAKKVLWFTSMVGKASSLTPLTEKLKNLSTPLTIRTTELFQGRTSRWCIGWSFHPSTSFLEQGWRYAGLEKQKEVTYNAIAGSDAASMIAEIENEAGRDEEEAEAGEERAASSSSSAAAGAASSANRGPMKRGRDEISESALNTFAHRSDRQRNVRVFLCPPVAEVEAAASSPSSSSSLNFVSSHVGQQRLSVVPSAADDAAIMETLTSSPDPSGIPCTSIAEVAQRIEEVLQGGPSASGRGAGGGATVHVSERRATAFASVFPRYDAAASSSWEVRHAWIVHGVGLGMCKKEGEAAEEDKGAQEQLDVLEFIAEVQVGLQSQAVSSTASSPPRVAVVISLLTRNSTAGGGGNEAFERLADRLKRDVLRQGRHWRRKTARGAAAAAAAVEGGGGGGGGGGGQSVAAGASSTGE